ncbi:MAG: hypothetical protein Q9O24_05510 [Gammaproteobacteria bacterium]|nr:hypothetical protein [Gammaproteobacteria bacterium]MDQ7074606.1 hypothetical protein [Gammaproteobacteria bacterium]
MINMKNIINAFRVTPLRTVPSVPKNRSNLIARRIVAKVSDGNVSLQMGNYVTQDQISERRKKVCSYTYVG